MKDKNFMENGEGGLNMTKVTLFSFVFLCIAFIAKLIERTYIGSHIFYTHYLYITMVLIILSPIIGLILSIKSAGKYKGVSIVLNIAFFILVAPLEISNFGLRIFGK